MAAICICHQMDLHQMDLPSVGFASDGFASDGFAIRWIYHLLLPFLTRLLSPKINKKSRNQTPRLQIKVYLKNAKPTPVLGSFVGGSAKIPPDSKCPIVKAKMAGKSAPTVKAELPTAVC